MEQEKNLLQDVGLGRELTSSEGGVGNFLFRSPCRLTVVQIVEHQVRSVIPTSDLYRFQIRMPLLPKGPTTGSFISVTRTCILRAFYRRGEAEIRAVGNSVFRLWFAVIFFISLTIIFLFLTQMLLICPGAENIWFETCLVFRCEISHNIPRQDSTRSGNVSPPITLYPDLKTKKSTNYYLSLISVRSFLSKSQCIARKIQTFPKLAVFIWEN